MRKLTGLISIVVLATCGLAACGDDDEALSKPDYIKAADDICRNFVEESEKLAQPTGAAEKAAYIESLGEVADETYDDFDALAEPEDAEDVHDQLLLALQQSTAKAREAQAAYENGDEVAGDAKIDEAVELGGAADDEAKAYGYEVCGSEDEL